MKGGGEGGAGSERWRREEQEVKGGGERNRKWTTSTNDLTSSLSTGLINQKCY